MTEISFLLSEILNKQSTLPQKNNLHIVAMSCAAILLSAVALLVEIL